MYEDDQPDDIDAPATPLRKQLAKLGHENKQLKSELARLRTEGPDGQAMRELAMRRAGVDPDSPLGALFVRAYEGEMEADAIRGAWSALGTTPQAGEADGEGQPSLQDQIRAGVQEEIARQAEIRAAIEGQRHIGEVRFGDLRPERMSSEDRLKADMEEAVAKVRATGAMDSRSQIEAVRGVLHQHNMVMLDEID